MTGTLEGRVVIVTGAGDGVGRGVALACASAGASVVIGTRDENGHSVVGEIDARSGRSAWVRCDVTDEATITHAVDLAVERFGALHAIVHNATSNRSSEPHRLEDVDLALWEEHAAVSLRGAYHCARAGFEALRANQGALVLMTSPAGMEGSVGLPLYSAVKGACCGGSPRAWPASGRPTACPSMRSHRSPTRPRWSVPSNRIRVCRNGCRGACRWAGSATPSSTSGPRSPTSCQPTRTS